MRSVVYTSEVIFTLKLNIVIITPSTAKPARWNSVVSMVPKLWAGRSGIRISAETRDFSLLQKVQTGCWAHPASCSVGTGV